MNYYLNYYLLHIEMIDVHIDYFVYVFNLHKLSLYCIQNKYYVTLLLLSLIVFKMCMMFLCKIVFVPGPHVIQLEVMVSTYSTIHFSVWVIYLTLSWESLDGLLPILYKWFKLQTDVPFGVAILLYFSTLSQFHCVGNILKTTCWVFHQTW